MSNKVRGKKDEQRKRKIEEHSAGILNTLALGTHIVILVLSLEPKTNLHSDADWNMKKNVGKSAEFEICNHKLWLFF